MARASYQNLAHIKLGTRPKARKANPTKTKPKISRPLDKAKDKPTSVNRTHKPTLHLTF